jgi:ankyrin repeat protein
MPQNRVDACCRNGHVACVEALIQASNHETNDDDVDGRTPLLLACLNGHHQAVQVLLALGGDVTKRYISLQA